MYIIDYSCANYNLLYLVHNELTVVARSWRTSGSWWGMRTTERKPVMTTITSQINSYSVPYYLLSTVVDILVAQLYQINGPSYNYIII